jgi:hypothetical protein
MSNHEPDRLLSVKAQKRLLPAKAQLTEDELSQICAAGIVLINTKRWGNLASRVSYGDLLRW